MIRVVPDINIIISAIFWRGNPYKVISKGISGEIKLITSPEILEEAINKLRTKFKFPEEEIQNFVDLVFTYYEIVEPTSKYNIVRDEKDNKILECAVDAKVDFILTGDEDLKVLKEFKGVRILSPGDFLKN